MTDLKEKFKCTGYERAKCGDQYYSVKADGHVFHKKEEGVPTDAIRYNIANYYTNEKLARNNARAENLMRKLKRFAIEHRKNKPDWDNLASEKYEICYGHSSKEFDITPVFDYQYFGSLYFDSRETAELALKEFIDELIWYFTEYMEDARYFPPKEYLFGEIKIGEKFYRKDNNTNMFVKIPTVTIDKHEYNTVIVESCKLTYTYDNESFYVDMEENDYD